MNEPVAVEETVVVTSPPSSPHELGNESPTETPESTPESTPEPETPEVSQEQQEIADLATEADNLAAGTEITPPAEQQQQQAPSMEETVTWLANTIYDWKQNGFPSQQQSEQQQQSESAEPGASDIYNSAFESPEEQSQTSNPTLQEFNALQQEVQQLRGVVEGVHAKTESFEKSSEELKKQKEEDREISDLQIEHKLSPEDARRTYIFMKNGEYTKGMRFARGRSQIEAATDQMVEQRANDRDMAGRPSLPGGTVPAPVASGGLLKTKLAEYRELPDGPAKDEAAQWLIGNGGVEELRKEVDSFHRNPPPPRIEESIL